MRIKFYYIVFYFPLLILTNFNTAFCQQSNTIIEKENSNFSFISIKTGLQMSGIKKEDFVKNNFSPLININIGKWINPSVGIQIAYKGVYFNTISDNKKHYYGFYYGEVLFNANVLLSRNNIDDLLKFNIHIGSGYFYNFYYDQPNICASLGFSSSYPFYKSIFATFELSSIMGWDIYQGDDDIIPNLSLGIIYKL